MVISSNIRRLDKENFGFPAAGSAFVVPLQRRTGNNEKQTIKRRHFLLSDW
jgi:hypothetical protein